MVSRLHRCFFVTVALALASLGACECTPPPGEGVARITAQYPNGSSVQSDGQTVLQVSLTATTATGEGDPSPISIEAPSGAVAARGATDFAASLSGNPNADGVFDFDFICDFRAAGPVTLAVANGTVSTNITVRCVEPRGDTVIIVDDSACEDFAADGESACRVAVTVEQRASVTIPLPGTLIATVVAATAIEPGATATFDVLSADGTSTERDTTTIVIDEEGHGEYWLHAPLVAETVELELTSSGVTIAREHEIGIFTNQATMRFSPPDGVEVSGGSTADLAITVTNPSGQPAGGGLRDTLTLTIEGGDPSTRPQLAVGGGTPSEHLEGVPITAGAVTVQVQTVAVTEQQIYTLTVSYQPLARLDPIVATIPVTVSEPGALLLELTATPTTIHSDSLTPTDLVASIDVTLTVDRAPPAGGTVTLTIPSDSSARLSFVGSDGVTEDPEDDARSFTLTLAGAASGSAQVRVTPNVPTGIARIVAVGRDDANNTVQREITINVERAPILQAIVFDTATPSVIGVQGGSVASSTAVSFLLFDDGGRAMPNVGVSFSSNATADRGITVTANAVSDAEGRVVTVLSAGTVPGPVTVRVSAESGLIGENGAPILRTSQSEPIPVVGGLPSFETSTFECGPTGVAAVYAPYRVTCKATLADKFSNVVPDLLVQFSAEAADEQATAAAADGVAEVIVASNEELRPMADVLGWSYGLAIPLSASELTGGTFSASDAAACFDNLASTPCDLLKLCDTQTANAQAFCPLPVNDGLCLDDTQASNVVAPGVRFAGALIDDTTLTPLLAATTRADDIADYVADYRSCGFPVSCLRGQAWGLGLDVVAGDHCPVNPGCMDFTTVTECPQDSVRTILAAVRGAEAFSDFNGNGIFDYVDQNGNGVHDPGEAIAGDAYVDLPEPYLDRNDNCARDDLTEAERFRYRPIEKVRNTDQFYDVNGDDAFGFDGVEHSGSWDFDTQIFLTDKILEISDGHLEVGEECPTAGVNYTCVAGGSVPCIETAAGENFARGCGIPPFSNTAGGGAVTSHTIAFRWTDGKGNCPSVNFSDVSSVDVDGSVLTTGSTDAELDYDFCSFSEAANPMLPYCTSVPFSASRLQVVTVTEDCGTTISVASQVELIFTLAGGSGRENAEYELLTTTLTCN